VTSAPAPAFVVTASPVTAADLGASWREGCPFGPDQLRRVVLTYWGFDDAVHQGALIVHVDAVDPVTRAFSSLFAQRFPIRNMEPVDKYNAVDDASMDADNTSAFNCRLAVTSGPASWSVHAFGKAIDVNPVENPYLESGRVLPPAGRDYLDRANVRPGMAVAGGPLVQAFEDVGWQWGGRAGGFTDYQHFSATGG
jgi:D-alanyl-D-alanine carboxypeptidase